MKNALNNQVGMIGDMFLWLVANLKQGVIYFIKQALPPNISAGSVPTAYLVECILYLDCSSRIEYRLQHVFVVPLY